MVFLYEVWLMEGNRGNLCCQRVSGQHLEERLPSLGLLMVYDCVWQNGSQAHSVTPCFVLHT